MCSPSILSKRANARFAPTRYAGAGAPGVAALRPLWPRNVRVGLNSPSLCPTMSSCTNTRRNLFPLWTSNVWPTNSGMIVHARDHVRIGCLDRFWFRTCTLRYSFSSTNGPFFALRLMGCYSDVLCSAEGADVREADLRSGRYAAD